MDTYTPKERSTNFTKNEKDRFQSLIEKYKDVLFCKKTDNTSNLKKNRTWAAIHTEFNACGEKPRSLRQLKAKFDNMKRSARKDASQKRLSRIRTGGGPPAPSVQPETEWFRAVMPISIDGLPSTVDDDVVENQSTIQTFKVSQPVKVIIVNENIEVRQAAEHKENYNQPENVIRTVPDALDNVFDTNSPAALLRAPVSKPLPIRKKLREKKTCQDLKAEVLKKSIEQGDNLYQLQIKHMEERRKEEKALYEKEMEILEIKKNKLLLEISLLENK